MKNKVTITLKMLIAHFHDIIMIVPNHALYTFIPSKLSWTKCQRAFDVTANIINLYDQEIMAIQHMLSHHLIYL